MQHTIERMRNKINIRFNNLLQAGITILLWELFIDIEKSIF